MDRVTVITNNGYYIVGIPLTCVFNTNAVNTTFVVTLRGVDFCVTVDNALIRDSDNKRNKLVVLRETNAVRICVKNDPSKPSVINARQWYLLLADTYGTVTIQNKPELKPVVQIEPQERERFVGMLNDVRIEGKYAPMDHQFDSAYFKAHHERAFDLSTMRTGKTGSTMLALEYLFRVGKINRVMILAPLSCVRPVWVDAIRTTMPRHVADAVTGTKSQRLKAFNGHADILCTNYESVLLHSAEWRAFKPDAIVIDECTHYANAESKRSKAIKAFIQDIKPSFVWGLTGTPGYDPLKAFAMSKLVNPKAVTCNTLYAWRDLTQYKYGTQAWQWKNRECAPHLIKQALSPAVLFKKDDLFDLPPVVYIARQVQPTTEQKRMMTVLRDSMVVVANSGEVVKAQQKSALASKLLQCACGCVYTDENELYEIDNPSRVDEIMDLIGEATGKTVIFSAFTGCINKLYRDLTARGVKVAVVDGSTTEKKRAETFRAFQYEPKGQSSVDVLIAHPRTTAFGVELASADMMIFDGAPLSGDFVFGQAVERLSSLKQKARQITIAQVYLCDEEKTVFNALRNGQTQSEIVANLFKTVTGVA